MANEELFVLDWVLKRTGAQITASEDLFNEGGLDSLDFVELLEDLEGTLGLRVEATLVVDWTEARTPRGLLRLARGSVTD